MTLKRRIFFYSAITVLSLGILYFLFHFRVEILRILTPFFLAVIIAYLINPLVIRLENRKISKMMGIIMIYSGFTLVFVFVLLFMIPELIENARELMNTLPDMTARYQTLFKEWMKFIRTSSWPEEIKNALFTEIQNGSREVQKFILETLRNFLASFINTVMTLLDIVLAMIIAYYFIKDGETFKAWALSLAPRKWRNGIVKTGREIHGILSNFIQGQLITAVIVGVMEMIGLYLIHIKYPLVLGLIGGVANIIPYFGPILGAIPAVAIALTISPLKVLETVIVFTIIQQIDNAFISPKIIEGKLGLHPVVTILAVLVGGEFFGILGMLISVPILAILKVIFKNSLEAII